MCFGSGISAKEKSVRGVSGGNAMLDRVAFHIDIVSKLEGSEGGERTLQTEDRRPNFLSLKQ